MIPAWFFRLQAAPVFAAPSTQLLNHFVTWGVVPQQWKKACITPIPKVASPKDASDYRPISITPVLSRMFERHIVRSYKHLRGTPASTTRNALRWPVRVQTYWLHRRGSDHTASHNLCYVIHTWQRLLSTHTYHISVCLLIRPTFWCLINFLCCLILSTNID